MKKIMLTGAPSSGKSSVMRELAKVYKDEVLLVPESAVVLLSGGFPAPSHTNIFEIQYFQETILKVQAGLEFILPSQKPSAQFAVFDRGSLDGAGFWPRGPEDFLSQFGICREKEYSKFTDVLFLELPEPEMFGGLQDHRFHNFEQSLQSEKQLESAWGHHPRFKKISAQPTLEQKLNVVLTEIKKILEEKDLK